MRQSFGQRKKTTKGLRSVFAVAKGLNNSYRKFVGIIITSDGASECRVTCKKTRKPRSSDGGTAPSGCGRGGRGGKNPQRRYYSRHHLLCDIICSLLQSCELLRQGNVTDTCTRRQKIPGTKHDHIYMASAAMRQPWSLLAADGNRSRSLVTTKEFTAIQHTNAAKGRAAPLAARERIRRRQRATSDSA